MAAGARRKAKSRDAENLRTAFPIAVWSAITLFATVIVSRRAGGAFATPTAAWAPCFAATIAVVLSLLANAVWRAADSSAACLRSRVLAAIITLVPPIGLGLALWTSPSVFAGGYLAALFVVSMLATVVIDDLASGGAAWKRVAPPVLIVTNAATQTHLPPVDLAMPSPAATPVETVKPTAPIVDVRPAELDIDVEEAGEEFAEDLREADPSLVQWMTRRLLPDGRELVEGSVRIGFIRGEKLAVAHVSFVPPLAGRPGVECHVTSDFDGRARVATARSYGLRIEARRSDDAVASASVDVAFSAQVPLTQAAAA